MNSIYGKCECMRNCHCICHKIVHGEQVANHCIPCCGPGSPSHSFCPDNDQNKD